MNMVLKVQSFPRSHGLRARWRRAPDGRLTMRWTVRTGLPADALMH